MRVLVTGNLGYLGSVLIPFLNKNLEDGQLIGFDIGFFSHCLTSFPTPEVYLRTQYFGDIRSIPENLLNDVDVIVHLAAISNDPMGNRFQHVTEEINYHGSIRLLECAVSKKVKKFIFASSCSMYGFAGDDSKKENDQLNPLTAYAKSKVDFETAANNMDIGDTSVTFLRFSTACGFSSRLRLDLVLNDFVACALSSKVISVLSDGSPWRPLIDVNDMSRAILWAILRNPLDSGQVLAVNVGANHMNYQIGELAKAVAQNVPGTTVDINHNALPDKRSYRVDFSLFNQLAIDFQPEVSLEETIQQLIRGMSSLGFNDKNFRNSQLMRLKVLENLVDQGKLTEKLYWV